VANSIAARISVHVCALLACTAGVAAQSTVHLQLNFRPGDPVPSSLRDAATVEAAALWHAYGVSIDARPERRCDALPLTLAVVFDLDAASGEAEGALGAVRFAPDGAVEPTVTLHYRSIATLATRGTLRGWSAEQWPIRMRDEAIARTLGRTLAHEIGHFLLRSPHHPGSGLMRSRQGASTFTDPDRKSFLLTELDRARLRIVLRASAAEYAVGTLTSRVSQCSGAGTPW
jgi:hypothetical protein